jgi:hypothetical protein
MRIVTGVVLFILAVFASRATIVAENLALRHQLGVLQRSVKRPRIRQRDRISGSGCRDFGPTGAPA